MKNIDDTQELYHFGVLGMKWGIKRNRERTLTKAYNKYNKLLGKGSKYDIKAAKLNYKAAKLKARGKFEKAMKFEGKAAKLTYKATKRREKAGKWARKALKIAYGQKLSKYDAQSGSAGALFLSKYNTEMKR